MISCASYKTQYSKDAANWAQTDLPTGELTHTMYLLGDAGNDQPGMPPPVLTYLQQELPKAGKNSSIVFLGDNIYEHGMPPKEDSAKRADAERKILAQLRVLDAYEGRPVFVPGNHDWRGWGLKGLKRQEKFIESYLNNRNGRTDKDDWEDYFLPGGGCSGAEVVELNNDVVLIVIDTQWWLRNWDDEPGMNSGCDVKNRAAFRFQIENVLRKYRHKQAIVAMHHPLYTYGSHGGAFTWRSHVFPLTDIKKDLYIPMPVIGTLGVTYRSAIGSRQDVANQHYQELRKALLAAAKKNGHYVFAAGHEHSLEYIEREEQTFIVSGAGSKTTPLKLGKGAEFVSGKPGFSNIAFYSNGDMLVRFYEVNAEGSSATLVFQKRLQKPKLSYTEEAGSFAAYEQHADTAFKTVTIEKIGQGSAFENFMLGRHHRDLYIPEYPFPVLDLQKFRDGVTPVKLGGGNQTNSLRVADNKGHEYVLRGLDKDVSRFLPFPFNRMTSARYIVRNNFLSTHPFAPLAVARLAESINVYHTNPSLYYVPAQPALGDYNTVFGNTVVLVEERPSGKKWKNAEWFGSPNKIEGTDDMLDNLLEDEKYLVDQSWTLRTRMLDWLVGDWDRHDDQWVWAAIELKDGSKIYRPIPRDRDQAFSKYDGMLTGIARLTMPFLRQLQVYGPQIANKKWNTWSARLFDRSFLNELTWSQWQEQVEYIQKHLTDSAIENAFKDWPQKARELTEANLINSIKQRRDDLKDIARTHFEFLARSITVTGTDEKERFVVERHRDGTTLLTVYELSKGENKKQLYQRLIENGITKYINLYGLGSGDEFVVTGHAKSGPKIRLVGGPGKDHFIDSSAVAGLAKKTIVYDDLRQNTVQAGPETKDRRTSQYRYNIYDRRDYASEYDMLMPMPVIGANPDDGFIIGANFNMTRYGFKKEPFKSQHYFGGSFAFGTQSLSLHYTGDYINALGNHDFYLEAHYHGPNFAFNYAGIGNETKRPIDDPNYYRVRQSEIFLYPAIKKRAGLSGQISLGPFLQINKIEATPDRFVTDSAGNKASLFEQKYFAGGRLAFLFNSTDNLMIPHSGIKMSLGFDYFHALRNRKEFSAMRGSFTFYKSLDRNENLVLASEVGGGVNLGDGYEFFQMPSIGGDKGLRGYRTERFYGRSSFYHSTDLRIRFGSSYNETLPFTLGVFGAFDYGRVWQKNASSSHWHYNWGGGLWLAPVDLLTLCLGAYVPGDASEEKPRVVLKLGFGF